GASNETSKSFRFAAAPRRRLTQASLQGTEMSPIRPAGCHGRGSAVPFALRSHHDVRTAARDRGTRLIHRAPGGFTLIEMIVAVSLTVLMMVLIGGIFDQTRRAVSRGMATGD